MNGRRARGVVRFGVFEADLHAGELRKGGIRIRLQEQPFQVLTVLLEHPGELISREELRREVWPEDTFVEFDHALNTAVKKIRVALSDDAGTPRYIETIPKRGYRWIAPLHAARESARDSSDSPAAAMPVPAAAIPNPARAPASQLPRARKLLAAAAMVLALLALLGLRLTREARAHSAARPLLVVLPFENWSANPAQTPVCRGLTEDLIALLASNPRLQVAPNATVMRYENTSRSVAEIGRELAADFVLQGNLRSTDQRLRVSAELIRVRDQARLWGDSFDHAPGDAVELEGDLARSIAAGVGPVLFSAAPGSAAP